MADFLNRTELLFGEEGMARVQGAKVIVIGIGGVGSWCAEALVRSGICHLTIADADAVAESNINRQVMATQSTVGRSKVEAMKERLLEINPEAEIRIIEKIFDAESADDFHLEEYDYIIDAIDSLKDKRVLLMKGSRCPGTMFSSMGSALKCDPTRIRTAEFWEVRGCPLGSIIRKRMRQNGETTVKPIICVYDDEVLENRAVKIKDDGSAQFLNKAVTNGSLCHITGIFGFTLAGLVLQDIYNSLMSCQR